MTPQVAKLVMLHHKELQNFQALKLRKQKN
jgi:hypothetical protein